MDGVCQMLGIEHTTSLWCMPQQNGLVERMHRQLRASLIADLKDRYDWPSVLPLVLLRMRATYKQDLSTLAAQLASEKPCGCPANSSKDPTRPSSRAPPNSHERFGKPSRQ